MNFMDKKRVENEGLCPVESKLAEEVNSGAKAMEFSCRLRLRNYLLSIGVSRKLERVRLA
jgi:hypothetical protein